MTITKVRDHTRGIFTAEYSWHSFVRALLQREETCTDTSGLSTDADIRSLYTRGIFTAEYS